MKLSMFLFLVGVLISGCIEQFDIPVIRSEPRIVVNGMITNEPGPYTVELYISSDSDEDLNNPNRIIGAVVSVWDDAGNSEILTEESASVYKTAAGGIQGTVGRIYQLKFTTADGTAYESIPAKLQPAGQIERLYYEFKKNEINKDDFTLPQHVVNIYADAKGEEGYPNLLRWRSSGIFQITTYPNLLTRTVFVLNPVTGSREPIQIPDPLPCSGFIPDPEDSRRMVQIGPCECCDCWVNDRDRKAIVSNNHVIDGISFNRVLLKRIVVDNWAFSNKYHFKVEQLSVQPEVYDFWKLISIQQQGSDNIFQPNTVFVKGNIECITDHSKKAYGIFSVSAITRKSSFVDVQFPPVSFPPVLSEAVDCKRIFDNSTYERPAFWID